MPPEMVGKPVLGMIACWVGDPAEGAEAMQPLRDLVAGGMDLVQPMPYTAFQAMIDGFAPTRLAQLPPRPAPPGADRRGGGRRSSPPAGTSARR